jgi:Zn-dependent M28 family amino/carboxypeptidase
MTDYRTVLDRVDGRTIDAHLRFLSHPLLEGRAPGRRGGQLAAEYVRSQFQRIGLEPVGGSHLQPVPMIGFDPHPELAFEFRDGEPLRPRWPEQYVAEAGVPETHVDVDHELVFVGYGIRAPEYDWDDYADVDVRGRVVLIRVNDPGTPDTPDFFGGRALTYYGRWTYKFEEASRQGAAGAILLHTDESAGYGWNVVRNSNTGEQYTLDGEPEHPLRVRGWLHRETALEVFSRSGLDLDELEGRSAQRGFRAVDTGARIRGEIRSQVQLVRTANVVGLLRGSHGQRAEEAVILSSHYDHLGVGTDTDGGSVVYHGAYDNASGVALLLAVAEAAATLPQRPARSLLFVSTTAEESGLLGAEWYARHPLIPLDRTAAVLNVDGANLQGRTRDIAPLGADRSELGEFLRRAAREEGIELAPEPHPEQGMFFRQDHFPFARAGVPAVALDHGLRFEDRPEGWGQRWYEEFVATHYHQPSDAYREDFDFGGAVQQGRVMLRTALEVAGAEAFPAWSESAEFSRPQGTR